MAEKQPAPHTRRKTRASATRWRRGLAGERRRSPVAGVEGQAQMLVCHPTGGLVEDGAAADPAIRAALAGDDDVTGLLPACSGQEQRADERGDHQPVG